MLLCYHKSMKCLKDFENELNKCSKCGLCEAACPLFKVDPNDCVASKGKFIMLHGVTKGDLKLSKKINKYIDLCLKCGKCNDFCPSGIDVCQILNTAKHEYEKDKFLSAIVKFLQSKYVFDVFLKLGEVISAPFRPKKRVQEQATNILYFKGCVNKICPKTDIYINKIFKDTLINIIEPNFDCCGLPFLSEGNLERFEQVATSNLEKLSTPYDFLVTDCASCESTLLDYPKYIENADIQTNKSINWGDLIALKEIKFNFKKPIKVTFHKPCHLKNDSFFEKIISNCQNVEYVKMDDYDECCGLAGSFSLKNPKTFMTLAKQKAQNIIKTNADYVITTCPACVAGLKVGLAITNGKTKVVSLLEFLSKGDVL